MKIHKMGSTVMLMRAFGDRMKSCYDRQTGERFRVLEVTEEVYKMGATCIVDEREATTDKDGMAEGTDLSVGDFVVITNTGVRRLTPNDFKEKYAF